MPAFPLIQRCVNAIVQTSKMEDVGEALKGEKRQYRKFDPESDTRNNLTPDAALMNGAAGGKR